MTALPAYFAGVDQAWTREVSSEDRMSSDRPRGHLHSSLEESSIWDTFGTWKESGLSIT